MAMLRWKNVRKILALEPKMVLLLFEAFFYLGYARILVFIPFSKMAPMLGTKMQETSYQESIANRAISYHIQQAIHRMSKYTFWKSQCLVKSIASMKMLEKRKIESTLYLGTTKDINGKLIAHAWLRSGSFYLIGAEEMHDFTVVGIFAKYIQEKNEGEWNE